MDLVATAFVSLLLAQAAGAQPAAEPPAAPGPSPPPSVGAARLPTGSEVAVELVDPISSKTSRLGGTFAIRVVEPIVRDGVTLVPAGTLGHGEVVDVRPAGMGGARGKLVIAARSLDLNGRPVRVRGMTFMTSGTGRVGAAMVASMVPYAGVAGFLIRGGDIEIPAGARGVVRLAEDIEAPPNASIQGPAAPAPPSTGDQQTHD